MGGSVDFLTADGTGRSRARQKLADPRLSQSPADGQSADVSTATVLDGGREQEQNGPSPMAVRWRRAGRAKS